MTITLTDSDTEHAGQEELPELAARPYWQDRPCPPWCEIPGGHSDIDEIGERVHLPVSVRYHKWLPGLCLGGVGALARSMPDCAPLP
jgi:hypothetical protein